MRLASAFPDDQKRVRDVAAEAQANLQLQASLRNALQTVPDPLVARATLADSLPHVPSGGQPRDVVAIFGGGTRMLRQLARISASVDGQLAEIALAVERGLAAGAGDRGREPQTAAR
jgi:hypothetical protein